MGPLDAIWHALNFFAPALGLAVLAASAAKLLWRHDLAGVPWLRLALWAALAGMAVLIGGLVVFGRDGKMATYAALVVAAAAALWVAGFVRR
jgi:formate-dependent nitrite reductase membrane component NrfD